jgi:hypothetical protein
MTSAEAVPFAHPEHRFHRRVKEMATMKKWEEFAIGRPEMVARIKAATEEHPVVVFSKTTDP